MHVDGPLVRDLVVGRTPQGRDEFGTLDGAPLTQHQVLQQFELLVGEGGGLVVEHQALTRDVHDDATGCTVLVLLLGDVAVLGDRRGVLECEADHIHVTPARAFRSESDGSIRLGGRREFGGETLQRLDDAAEVRAGRGGLRLVDADVEDEPAGFGPVGDGADLGRRGCGRSGRSGSEAVCGGVRSGFDGCERHWRSP